jgi:hypothetical protein
MRSMPNWKGGQGNDTVRPPLLVAASRPTTEGKRNTRVGGPPTPRRGGLHGVAVTPEDKVLGMLWDTRYAHVGYPWPIPETPSRV